MESKNLAKNEKNGIVYYTFPAFDKCGVVKHGISTRFGGVSSGYFSTMNFSTLVGDSEECVLENYKRFCDAIGVDYKKCVASKQTHTVNIRTVTADDIGKGVIKERDYSDVDGLITNIPEITLVTHYADCVPLAFVDPVKKVIALAHSGWKGTVGKIGELTVERMVQEFGCEKKDILCGIGPSICRDCFEVDSPVSDIFLSMEGIGDKVVRDRGNGKFDVDLWKANYEILVMAGIPKENITVTDLCTKCNPDVFHSHRATGGKRGIIGVFLSLK